MRQGIWQVLMGLVLGIGSSTILLAGIGPTVLQDFLFKVNAFDPSIYGVVAILISVVAVIACFVPARRATRVDPLITLRTE
jgi:putative ABC transport system permease protein